MADREGQQLDLDLEAAVEQLRRAVEVLRTSDERHWFLVRWLLWFIFCWAATLTLLLLGLYVRR